jgi:hypothetical protein
MKDAKYFTKTQAEKLELDDSIPVLYWQQRLSNVYTSDSWPSD